MTTLPKDPKDVLTIDLNALSPTDLVTLWHVSEQQRDLWVVAERRLRDKLFTQMFPTPKVGTNKRPIGFGMQLVATHKINYTADPAIVAAQGIPAELKQRVFRLKPEVNVSEYKALVGDELRWVSPFVTEKPGAPSLELKAENRSRK